MALVLITHDMGVVAETAQRVAVMYAGQVVEERSADALFAAPAASLHRGAARGAARAQRRRDAARHHSRRRARALRPAARLPVRAALRLRRRRAAARGPPLRPGRDGRVRCHYPLGAAGRRDGAACAEAAPARATARRMSATRRRAVVDARDLTRDYEVRARPVRASRRGCRRSTACRSPSTPGGRWRWSANRAAASRRWRAW